MMITMRKRDSFLYLNVGHTHTHTDRRTLLLMYFWTGLLILVQNIWYYQLNLDRTLGKTNALNEKDLEEFVTLYKKRSSTENSWLINLKDINIINWDLTATNPNKKDTSDKRTPEQILVEIENLDNEISKNLLEIKKLINL